MLPTRPRVNEAQTAVPGRSSAADVYQGGTGRSTSATSRGFQSIASIRTFGQPVVWACRRPGQVLASQDDRNQSNEYTRCPNCRSRATHRRLPLPVKERTEGKMGARLVDRHRDDDRQPEHERAGQDRCGDVPIFKDALVQVGWRQGVEHPVPTNSRMKPRMANTSERTRLVIVPATSIVKAPQWAPASCTRQRIQERSLDRRRPVKAEARL